MHGIVLPPVEHHEHVLVLYNENADVRKIEVPLEARHDVAHLEDEPVRHALLVRQRLPSPSFRLGSPMPD